MPFRLPMRRPSLEVPMGDKGKGGKTTKKVGIKQKRLDKKAKQAGRDAKSSRGV